MRAIATLAMLLATLFAHALEVAPPPYQVRDAAEGVIRIWGNPEMKPLLDRWEGGMRRAYPKIRIESHLTGSDVGMAGLYTGQADVVLIGRAATAPEVKAFEWIYRYRPLGIEVAAGSLDQAGKSPALAVYVHRDNPLRGLTLAQLDAIFSRERLRGAPATITSWRGLGLGNEWADRRINLYMPDAESGTGRFFREGVLENSRMLDWDRITELADTSPLRSPTHDASRRTLAALERDRYGLAVASGPSPPSLRAIAIAGEDGVSREATREEVGAGRYALSRTAYAYVNRRPKGPLDAPVAAFLRYVLSDEGQENVGASNAYLPLGGKRARDQASRLQGGG